MANYCAICGKPIGNVEYIRYGGICQDCWHKETINRKHKKKC